jgi:uncharacterized protein (DUF1810 family)
MTETRTIDVQPDLPIRPSETGSGADGHRAERSHNAAMHDELERFLVAQRDVYDDAMAELRRGRKTSHWMWFVFPQIAGLGHSAMSQHFAIAGLDEARAYLAHPVLGARLRECAEAVLATGAPTAVAIFGPTDAMKLRSSMTLFHRAVPDEPLFRRVLDNFYAGVADAATDRVLSGEGGGDDRIRTGE